MSALAQLTYVLPIRSAAPAGPDLARYLGRIAQLVPVIVADGSPPEVFEAHARAWPAAVMHVPLDDDRRGDANGKAGGVVTALRRVSTPYAVIADDDVRYDAFGLRRLIGILDGGADVVRPQNVFAPLPWHALLDTGRILIARATGGDWPGTLGVRMETYRRAGSYAGDVLFENLEFVRTMRAVGGREQIAADCFVLRLPPSAAHYYAQRVRQAYDELARPGRLALQLAIGPAVLIASLCGAPVRAFASVGVASIVLAEAGRRRDGGVAVFPAAASLAAPVWVFERALTSWAAVALRVVKGGVRYSQGRLRTAAHTERVIRARIAA